MIGRLLRALDRYWFAPARVQDLAIFRILCVGSWIVLFLPRPSDTQSLAMAEPFLFRPILAVKMLMAPFGWGVRPEPMFLHAVWFASVVAGVCAVVGKYTRPSLFVLAAGTTLLCGHLYSYGEVHHGPVLMSITFWVLACSPAGAALSLDALQKRRYAAAYAMRFEPAPPDAASEYAGWPLRVVQWLLALAYFSAGTSKLHDGGLAWMNGYTLAFYTAKDGLRWGMPLGIWIAQHPTVAAALSVGAVFLEVTFFLAILVPRLAWPYVLSGVAMHTGIYFAQYAPFFEHVPLFAAFMQSLRRYPLWRRAPAPRPRPWTVIYDGICPLCLRTMVTLDAMDLRRRLTYMNLEQDWAVVSAIAPGLAREQARSAMVVVSPEGVVFNGFAALRQLAKLLPPLWPTLLILHLPFSAPVGNLVYGRVAASRKRLHCAADVCAV